MKTIRKMLTLLAVACLIVSPAAIAGGSAKSEAPVYWTFDLFGEVVGSSKIVRTKNGITAQVKTTGLIAGHAMTMWIIFFNNPEECAGPVCDPAVDGGNALTGFDFHYAAGHIVNGNETTLSGHLQVGELSTSGLAELGAPPTALVNPQGAQVAVAVHSHGPAQTGQNLAAQLSSFLGGCFQGLLGPGGIAADTGDIPVAAGECSTIQLAPH